MDVIQLHEVIVRFLDLQPEGVVVPPYSPTDETFNARCFEGLRMFLPSSTPLALVVGGREPLEQRAFLLAAQEVYYPGAGPIFFPKDLPNRLMLIKLRMSLFQENIWYHYPEIEEGFPTGLAGRWTTGG